MGPLRANVFGRHHQLSASLVPASRGGKKEKVICITALCGKERCLFNPCSIRGLHYVERRIYIPQSLRNEI